jgi:hypothetical protein
MKQNRMIDAMTFINVSMAFRAGISGYEYYTCDDDCNCSHRKNLDRVRKVTSRGVNVPFLSSIRTEPMPSADCIE